MKMEEQTHVLPPKEHPKPAKDPKRQEAGRKGAEARKRNRDTLLAELAAAKQHARDTDVVVPKELEWMQHAHNMTEGTHSVPPQDNKENTVWSIVLLGGGGVAIIVFKAGADSKVAKKQRFLVNDLFPNKDLRLGTHAAYSRWNRQLKMFPVFHVCKSYQHDISIPIRQRHRQLAVSFCHCRWA